MEENGLLVSGNCRDLQISEDDTDLRRGPWTVEEDFTLINYIAQHGDGRWNSLARCAGLKRTGKSCRLRWLNYLRPEVRRGNITLEEQLLILELHFRWGNRWSKIAQHLPGRTDNEIKNYWRTRVQKHAKQLKCDVNSKQFKDTIRYLWMPRLVERIQSANAAAAATSSCNSSVYQTIADHSNDQMGSTDYTINMSPSTAPNLDGVGFHISTPETSSADASSDSFAAQVSPSSDLTECYNYTVKEDNFQDSYFANYCEQSLTTFDGYFNHGLDFQGPDQSSQWINGGDLSDNLWNVDDTWF